jgi:hypothetical protein
MSLDGCGVSPQGLPLSEVMRTSKPVERPQHRARRCTPLRWFDRNRPLACHQPVPLGGDGDPRPEFIHAERLHHQVGRTRGQHLGQAIPLQEAGDGNGHHRGQQRARLADQVEPIVAAMRFSRFFRSSNIRSEIHSSSSIFSD